MLKKDLDAELNRCINTLMSGKWYEGKQLDHQWKVTPNRRKTILKHMMKRGLMRTKGITAMTRYRVVKVGEPTTGNGVIDAKLRKEAGLPETPTSLGKLISAATDIGTENEVLKQALRDVDAIITKVREYL